MVTISAHGRLVHPEASFLKSVNDKTAFCGTIEGKEIFPNGNFHTSPEANVASFSQQFISSNTTGSSLYTNIKSLIQSNVHLVSGAQLSCGFTTLDTKAHSLNEPFVWWGKDTVNYQQGNGLEGFTPSHHGPCEIWCDQQMVLQNMDCPLAFNNGPTEEAKLPIDLKICQASKVLTLYWIAMHSNPWQVYINCIPLSSIQFNTSIINEASVKPALQVLTKTLKHVEKEDCKLQDPLTIA
jgi:hypothetical protein